MLFHPQRNVPQAAGSGPGVVSDSPSPPNPEMLYYILGDRLCHDHVQELCPESWCLFSCIEQE